MGNTDYIIREIKEDEVDYINTLCFENNDAYNLYKNMGLILKNIL